MKNLIRHKQKIRLGEGPGWGSEWWDKEDWDRHKKYVEELKKEGRYLEEIEVTIDFVPCPLFDKQQKIKGGKAVGMLVPTNKNTIKRLEK